MSSVGLLFADTDGIELGGSDGNIQYDDGTDSNLNSFRGEISEFIYCNEPASFPTTQRDRIESYLAIKYGITLDQASPNNYVNSDGDIIFNTTISAALGGFLEYNNDIAGIGRDDAAELEQLSSKSENAGSIVQVDRNTDIGNDDSWLIWGNDGAPTTASRTESKPNTINERLERVWRVAEEKSVGVTDVSFDLMGLGLGNDASDFSILIANNSSNGDFSGATVVTTGVFVGDVLTFPDLNLTDGQYFTLGTQFFICTPGNVQDGLSLWIKADAETYNTGTTDATDGQTVATWGDQSRNDFDALNNGNRGPLYVENSVNFNPGLNWNAGTNTVGFNLVDNYIFAEDDGGGLHVFSAVEPVDVGTNNSTRQRKMIYSFGNRAAANVGYGVSTLRGTIQSPGSDQNSGISTTGPSFIAEADYDISAGASDVRRLIIDGNVVRENTLSFQLNDAAITQNSTHASNRGPVSIGRLSETNGLNNQNGRRFFGEMSEVIVYNEEITDLQEQQVRSYLAIKYGTTLTDDNNDNSTANEVLGGAVVEGDYVASDGTTITWDYSDDTGFVNNVAGIGRDDDTCLEQRQSRSVNSDAILTVGLGEIATTNADNPNTFDDDLDFLTWGTDGASTDFGDITTAGTPGTVTERMLRVWRAQDTGDVGPTDISFDLTTLPGYSANAADYQLIIAGGGDNTSLENGTTVTGGTFDGTVLTFSGVDLADGQYFTLGVAADLCGPGGITTDMVLWLRGDQGTSTLIDNSALNTWTDQSLGANNGVQDGNAPLFRNDPDENINFNPTVEFDGTNDRLSVGDLAEIKSATGTGRYSMFGIGLRDDATTNYVIGSEGGTTNQDLHFGYRNSTSVAIAQWGNDLDATVTAFDSPVATPFLIGAIYDGAGKVIEESRDDNFVRNTNNNTVDLSGTKTNFIGDLGSVGNYNGRISEVLVYNRAVTTLEKLQIYSYFAIKYGITLTQDNNNNLTLNETISGSVAEGDLVASDGTTIIWDESFEDYDDYHNGMAGIGRDDAACLNQKQSTSATDGTILTMGLGTITSSNAENTGLHDNLDFLVWGHDGVAADKTTAEGDLSDLPSTVSERMRRVWRVEDTGTVDATEIQFDLTSLGYSTSDASDYRLIIADASSGGTMAGGTLVTGGTFNGDVLSFTGIDLTDGQYFTLGTALETCGPGGVNTNIALWLRADLEVFSDAGITAASDGNNVEQWNDQSSPADNGSESNLGGGGPIEPTFETNEINFNPVLNFTDPNSSNASYIETGTNSVSGDMTLISVFRTGQSAGTPDDFENSPTLIGASETTSDLDYGLGMQNGTIWVHANSTAADVSFDAQTGNTFRNNEPHFVTATRTQSSGTITIYVDANSEATGTGSTTALTAPTSFGIGNHSDGNQNAQYNGDIAESIVYSSVLTSDERNRVESYLALKYGLTMDASDDGGTGGVDERDYRAADGGDIWDFDGQGATYYNDIFGIGRDDLSCFEQTSAKSENNDALVTFEEPSGSFDTNDSFIVSGNDNADIESTDNTEKPDGINSRLNREWRVQETGTVGTIELTYDLSTITGPTGVGTNNLTQLRLLVDDDGDFSNGGTTFISPSSIDGSNETATFEVDFTDGQYYTLGSIEIAALPITLISFEVAVNEDNEVKLDWTTATEVNNSFYTIERSTDGINFETVANIDGAGNSNAVLFYTYVDTKPVNGLSFYRLKQTDFNGEFDYSQVRSVRVAEIKKEFKASYKAYPNPIAKGEVLKIGYELEKDQTLSLIIINRTGQVIRREEHTVFITEEYIEVSTKGFETGLNLIRIIDESGNTATLKIIIR